MFTRTKFTVAAVAIAISTLGGCVTNPSRQDVGTVLGAIVGGVVGSQFGGGNGNTLFTIAGALGGAWAGSSIGKHMDEHDRRNAEDNLQENLDRPDYGNVNRNWNRGNRHYETHSYTGRSRGLAPHCKEYLTDTTIWIDGRPHLATSSGIACLNHRTGQWEIQPQKVDPDKWERGHR